MSDVLGWDLEIAKEFPAGGGDWHEVAPLGISCAAIAGPDRTVAFFASGALSDKPLLFLNGGALSVEEARAMALDLKRCMDAGATLVTWNGLGFDFPVLAQECQSEKFTRLVAEMALGHIDLAFNMLCDRGFMIKLDVAAKGLGLTGKLAGMSGALAPVLWTKPDRELTSEELLAIHELRVEPGTVEARRLCLEYVKQDAVTTQQVYVELLKQGSLGWITRTGKWARTPWTPFIFSDRVYTCKEANETDLPDTKWMTFDPPTRESAIGWALEAIS